MPVAPMIPTFYFVIAVSPFSSAGNHTDHKKIGQQVAKPADFVL
jgi:hypothetical protein